MKTKYRYCAACKCLHDTAEWPHHAEPEREAATYIPGQNYDDYLMGPRSGTFRKCKACGDLHDIYNWPDNHFEEPPPRSDLAAPFFISDNLEGQAGLNGFQSMADGKFYTSKAKMRAEYRARGMVEMGNDKPAPLKKPKPDRKAIKEAVHKAINAVENGARVENYVKQRKKAPIGGRVTV